LFFSWEGDVKRYQFIVLSIISLLLCGMGVCDDSDGPKDDNQQKTATTVTPAAAVREAIAKGNLEEAEHIISNIDGNEYARLSFLGIIALKRQQSQKAIRYFEKARTLDGSRPELQLLMAQAFFQNGELQKTLTALKKGQPAGGDLPSYYQFRGGVEAQLEQFEAAWTTFNSGYQRFPEHYVFLKELAVVMIRAGLFATALDYGDAYLRHAPHDVAGILVIAHALLSNHHYVEAAGILEEAVARSGAHPDLLATLAASYGSAGNPLAAGRILARAVLIDSNHAFDAAQYFIAAKNWREALNMNLRVENAQKRLSQRLRIHFKRGRFSRAIATGVEMQRENLMTDEDRYCLVYAWLQLGNHALATKIAEQIADHKWKKLSQEMLSETHPNMKQTR
jgi:predicted Zn-dependent protease